MVLSIIKHKEQRFISQIFIPFAICWSFCLYKVHQFLPRCIRTSVLKTYLVVSLLLEVVIYLKQFNCFSTG